MITTVEQWKSQTYYEDGVLATANTLLKPATLVKEELNELKALVDILYGREVQLWTSSLTYTNSRIVRYGTKLYVALDIIGNINKQPDISPTYWRDAQASDYPRGNVIKVSASEIGDNALNGVIPTNSGMVYISTVDSKYYLVTDANSNNIFGYLDISKLELYTNGLVTIDSIESGTWTKGEFIYLSLDEDGRPVDIGTNNSLTKLGIAFDSSTFYLSLAIGASGGTSSSVTDVTRLYVTATEGQTIFNITGGYEAGHVDVFQNGFKLSDENFDDSDGVNIVLAVGAKLNDKIDMIIYRNLALADIYSKNEIDATINALGIEIDVTLKSANIIATTWVLDNLTQVAYDTGNIQRLTYDGVTNNLIQTTISDSIDNLTLLTISYTYDINNKLETIVRS